jgi:hypothetical protein
VDDDDQDAGHNVSVVYMTEDNGKKIEFRLENDKRSATIDGKSVPANRIRDHGDKIEILDEDGTVAAAFDKPHGLKGTTLSRASGGIGGATTTWRPLNGQQGGATAWSVPGNALAITMGDQPEPPPVMLGITMGGSGGEDEEGVEINSVMPGLPAAKAGLKEGDRMLSLDGKKIEDQKQFRELLKSKKGGESAKLKINRDGEEKTLTITFEAFDAKILNDHAPAGGQYMVRGFSTDRDDKWYTDAIDAIAKAMDEVRASDALNGQKFKDKATAALEKAKASLEEAKGKMHSEMDRVMAMRNLGNGQMLFGGRSTQPFQITPPVPPVAPRQPGVAVDDDNAAARMDKRMERLDRTLEKLDRRLEEIERRLDRKDGDKRDGR